jgi:flagellar assembly factor FliW
MKINTRHFGEIEILEDKIITFKEGIPSFEDVRKYVLIDSGDVESPFKWLQSVDRPTLAFAIVDPFLIKKDYEINIDDNTLKTLGIEKGEDVEVFAIVVVPEDVSKMTMNLKAPVVINRKNREGMQVVLDTDKYGVRHYILDELRRQGV